MIERDGTIKIDLAESLEEPESEPEPQIDDDYDIEEAVNRIRGMV
jgi:hypothetical protein